MPYDVMIPKSELPCAAVAAHDNLHDRLRLVDHFLGSHHLFSSIDEGMENRTRLTGFVSFQAP